MPKMAETTIGKWPPFLRRREYALMGSVDEGQQTKDFEVGQIEEEDNYLRKIVEHEISSHIQMGSTY